MHIHLHVLFNPYTACPSAESLQVMVLRFGLHRHRLMLGILADLAHTCHIVMPQKSPQKNDSIWVRRTLSYPSIYGIRILKSLTSFSGGFRTPDFESPPNCSFKLIIS